MKLAFAPTVPNDATSGSWSPTPLFVVYRLVAPTRGAVVLRDLLGPVFAGILGSDRCS